MKQISKMLLQLFYINMKFLFTVFIFSEYSTTYLSCFSYKYY